MSDVQLTVGKWSLSFGTQCTFGTREEARTFIKEDPDKKFTIMKPQPIPNERYIKPLPTLREKHIQTFKLLKAKKPPLEGNGALTLSLNALDEITLASGLDYHRDLYMEILECTIRECRPCQRKECPGKDDTQKCWAEDRLTTLIRAGKKS